MTVVHLIADHSDALKVIDASIADIAFQVEERSPSVYVVVKMGQFAYKATFKKDDEDYLELIEHLDEKRAIQVSESVDVETLFR
jgi:hypothetical protein